MQSDEFSGRRGRRALSEAGGENREKGEMKYEEKGDGGMYGRKEGRKGWREGGSEGGEGRKDGRREGMNE